MANWVHILKYSPRLAHGESEYGYLQEVSANTEHAIVYFPKKDESRHVHLTWSERIPRILEVVELCTAFRIEVYVHESHIMTYVVSVNPAIFRIQVKQNNILGEHHIISLIKEIWKNSYTHDTRIRDHEKVEILENQEISSDNKKWKEEMLLMDHQYCSLQYMKNTEKQIFQDSSFNYDVFVEISTTGYYIDLIKKKITKQCEKNTCHFRGAFLCDETGSGKTVVSLKLICDQNMDLKFDEKYFSKATLIIVPINLPNQWLSEIEKFYNENSCNVVKLWKGGDMKNLTIESLLNCDIVLTTISFIKSCKVYNDMLQGVINDNVKGNIRKSRALFNTIKRNPNIILPILQIIHWKRIIVDEIHEIKGRDLRILKCFSCSVMWGLTATPTLNNTKDELNEMNFMLEDLNVSHPNIYKTFVEKFVRGTVDLKKKIPANNLNLVELTQQEISRYSPKDTDEQMILNFSSLNDRFTFCSHEQELENLIIEPEEHRIQETSMSLLSEQKGILVTCMVLTAIWCVENIRNEKIKKCQVQYKAIELLAEQRSLINSITQLVTLVDETKRRKVYMEENFDKLINHKDICPICMENTCSIITRCGHLFCENCICKHLATCHTCPNCRHVNYKNDTFKIISEDENSKLNAIKQVVTSTKEPIVIFAQWKKILKDIKIVLTKSKIKAVILEGNVNQRAIILRDFKSYGGVLLVCATDQFAGLRLTNVNYILFAHALLGDYNKVKSIEMQAIGRTAKQEGNANVSVLSFVTANSKEESLWRTNHPM